VTEEIAEPLVYDGPPSPLAIDFELSRALYGTLTVSYARALGYVGSLRRRRPTDDSSSTIDPVSRDWVASVARLLTGAHIRKRLEALSSRCAQLEPALDRDTQQVNRAWLAEVRGAAEATAASLPSLRRPSVYVLAPFLFGLISAGGGLAIDELPKAVWAAVSAVVFVIALIMFAVTGVAYRHKRQALLPGAATIDRLPRDQQLAHGGENAYRTEDELFAALGTGRAPEAELDSAMIGLGCFLTFEFTVVYGVVFVGNESVFVVLFLGGFGVLAACAALGDWLFPKRVWR
jgi:hypothetical protein